MTLNKNNQQSIFYPIKTNLMKKNLFAILALPALVAVSCSNEEPI